MKINFDDLFSKTMPQTTIPSSFPHDSRKNNKYEEPINKEKQLSGKTKLSISRNVELGSEKKQENGHNILQTLNKLTKMIQEKQAISRNKSKVNIQELTNKLNQPPPSARKNCTKNCKSIKQQTKINSKNRKNTLKSHHKSTAQNGFPRYVRLYNLGKINSIKNLYRAQSHREEFDRHHSKQQFRTKISDSYLQNYVPFYDRLQNEIHKSVQKQKFYDNNPQLACGQLKQLFKPTIIPDKYKNKIECRYNKSTKSTKNTNQLEQALNSSLNTSFCSLDKSVEIINRVEQHFFNKMKLVFLNQSHECVVITQHIINMLSQVQFKTLQNFIMEAEMNPIHNENFQARLRDYYYNLPPNEKLELRNHQTRKKPKTSQQMTLNDHQSFKSFKKKPTNPSKYLKKVESFV